jgi:glycosyltransferase involved in cell wall biosynthesis
LGAKVTLQMYEPMPELWMTRTRFSPLISLLEVIQRLSLRYAHGAFAVTQQLKDSFVARGADPDKITVILNAPDERCFEAPVVEPLPSADGEFRLICHGAIEARYGHDTMLEAICSLRSTIPNIRLRILGSGSYLSEFLAQIEALGLSEHVQYLGYVPLAQLVEELRKADIGIVAQKSSPYSNLVHTGKMYDYLYFNKPVVASRLRSVNAYFGEGSLCYSVPGDAADLARAIRHLYEHPEAREALVRNSRCLYERYRWAEQRMAYMSASRRLAGLEAAADHRTHTCEDRLGMRNR